MTCLADGNMKLVGDCVSRLLTFLGNEFVKLSRSFCSDKRIGTVFHSNKVDMQSLLSHSLYANII